MPARQPATVPARLAVSCLALLGVLVAVVLYAAATGPVSIPPGRALSIVAEALGLPAGPNPPAQTAVLLQIRLPRVVVGALVGAALSVSGVALQGTFRNPLAEPGVIGVSAGGALGAVLAIYLGLPRRGGWFLPAMAFVGSALAIGFVFLVSRLARRQVAVTMLMVGVAVNALLGSVISVLLATARSEEDLRSIVFWLQGGLDARTWRHAQLAVWPVLVGCVALWARARDLNVLVLGDDQGRASGVDVTRSRVLVMVFAALATGAAVAVSGAISFVGMVVPHALRLVLGPDHRVLLPASALAGAAFLVLADVVARTLLGPVTLQVGVVTSFVGAPVLLAFVLRNRRSTLT